MDPIFNLRRNLRTQDKCQGMTSVVPKWIRKIRPSGPADLHLIPVILSDAEEPRVCRGGLRRSRRTPSSFRKASPRQGVSATEQDTFSLKFPDAASERMHLRDTHSRSAQDDNIGEYRLAAGVSGHEFTRAVLALENPGFSPCGLKSKCSNIFTVTLVSANPPQQVSGHDFSRAVLALENPGFSPCASNQRREFFRNFFTHAITPPPVVILSGAEGERRLRRSRRIPSHFRLARPSQGVSATEQDTFSLKFPDAASERMHPWDTHSRSAQDDNIGEYRFAARVNSCPDTPLHLNTPN